LTGKLGIPKIRGMAQADLLLTGAAADYLGVSDETLRRWAEDKKIRHVRLPSGQLRFRREDLDAALVPVEPEDAA
jgi:excisionase family DNA binding protein